VEQPEWVTYRRLADRPVEAMHAHFRRHTYHRHSHETYSFGLTESGAQAFGCRGAERTSAAGMVMAFNPDEPHDGRTATEHGFTYRIVHIGPELVADVLSDKAGRPAGLPLFTEPVLVDPVLAAAVGRLHASLLGHASTLARTRRWPGRWPPWWTGVRGASRWPRSGTVRPSRSRPGPFSMSPMWTI